jgi:hypothetical protein
LQGIPVESGGKPGSGAGDEEEVPPYQQRERLVTAGDVRGLLEMIRETPSNLLDLRAAFDQLRRAIDVASRDPRQFADDLFRTTASFAALVMLRVQLLCEQSLAQTARTMDSHGGRLGNELVDMLLPQLQRLQSHWATLAQAWASTARMWALAGRRPQGGGGEPPADSSPRDRVPPNSPRRKPPNRLNGQSDGSIN